MGSKYKEKLEREWDGKSLSEMRRRTVIIKTDRNITDLLKDKKRRYR